VWNLALKRMSKLKMEELTILKQTNNNSKQTKTREQRERKEKRKKERKKERINEWKDE
jgi:hypothetical protein